MSTFYVVATPIGNLADVTLRALDVLRSVDLILCEDTRVTAKLLGKYGISKPTLSYHAHSRISRVTEIVGMLEEGKNIALVSDAGTPGISDPGAELVAMIRQRFALNGMPSDLSGQGNADLSLAVSGSRGEPVKVECVPGASALAAALSVAGVPIGDGFDFLGFLPHKKGRETIFREIGASERVKVFYESPHRIIKTLASLSQFAPGRQAVVCRELTKVFEEVVRGSAAEVESYFLNNPEKVKGEFVVIVY